MTMAVMSASARDQRPRQAILGQLPRISRDDGSPIRVLLVDDEPALTNLVKMALHYEGWTVEVAHNGREAVSKFDDVEPDVLVLDIMLPDVDGLQILQRIRESGPYTPTLFLTARDSVMDRVTGLTAGADDYMTKPFSLEELVARLRGLLRRSSHLAPPAEDELTVGDLTLDEVLSKREDMNSVLRLKLDDITERWGVKVTTVEVREVNPPVGVLEVGVEGLVERSHGGKRGRSVKRGTGGRCEHVLVALVLAAVELTMATSAGDSLPGEDIARAIELITAPVVEQLA